LQNMDASEKEKLNDFYKSAGEQITVRSTFEVPEESRRKIQEILNDQIGIDVKMQYTIAPELICGVEMSAHSTRISWSIASYLNTLDADLSEVLTQRAVEESQETDVVENGDNRK